VKNRTRGTRDWANDLEQVQGIRWSVRHGEQRIFLGRGCAMNNGRPSRSLGLSGLAGTDDFLSTKSCWVMIDL